MTLDTGHVVAFDDTIHYAVRKSGAGSDTAGRGRAGDGLHRTRAAVAADAEQQRTSELAGRTVAFPARLLVLDRLGRLRPARGSSYERSLSGVGVASEAASSIRKR